MAEQHQGRGPEHYRIRPPSGGPYYRYTLGRQSQRKARPGPVGKVVGEPEFVI